MARPLHYVAQCSVQCAASKDEPFFQHIGTYLTNYMALHLRRQKYSFYVCIVYKWFQDLLEKQQNFLHF